MPYAKDGISAFMLTEINDGFSAHSTLIFQSRLTPGSINDYFHFNLSN
jgi:hypothetical protein